MITFPPLVPIASCWKRFDHMLNVAAHVIDGASRKGGPGTETSQRKMPTPCCMIASVYPSGDQSSLMGCPGPRLCVAVARGVGFAARSYKISRPLPSFSVATANCALLPGLHADMTLLSPSEVGVRCIWHVNAVFLDPRTVMATSFAALAVVRKSPPDRLRSPPSVVRLTSSASVEASVSL